MKAPTETVKGRIVGYDERTGELLIRARYDDWVTMTRREFKECLVQPIDSRPLSDKQRRACYALLREISDYTGMGQEQTKELMKLKFLAEELQETADRIFSLSNAPMSLVCAFQRFLVRFILDWDIPCGFPLLNFVDDVQDYVYTCLVNKKCCVCGARADLHHVDHVGMGRNRNEIIHEGMKALPLCREHHTEVHAIGQDSFKQKYHLNDGIEVDRTIAKIYKLKTRKDEKSC
jgi:hypothetical protein